MIREMVMKAGDGGAIAVGHHGGGGIGISNIEQGMSNVEVQVSPFVVNKNPRNP